MDFEPLGIQGSAKRVPRTETQPNPVLASSFCVSRAPYANTTDTET